MTNKRLSGLRSVLDRRNWQWLEDEAPDVAGEIEKAVADGATPEEIGTEMLSTIGEHRKAFVINCVSAARFLAQKV